MSAVLESAPVPAKPVRREAMRIAGKPVATDDIVEVTQSLHQRGGRDRSGARVRSMCARRSQRRKPSSRS